MAPSDARLWSRFGPRMGFTSRRPQFHAGTDFGAPEGTPVYAPRAGVVQNIAHEEDGLRGNPFSGYGNAVALFHADENLWSFYAHLSDVAVAIGQEVQPGQLLGRSGRMNNGKFPGMPAHLHMEVRHARSTGASPYPGPYRTNNIDPLAWLISHGVNIGRDGFIVSPELDACPSPQPQMVAVNGLGSLRIGSPLPPSTGRRPLRLVGLGDASDATDSDTYEPPLTEDGDLISLPWGVLFGIGIVGVGLIGLHQALK
jgi:hypothetical protein